MVLTTYRGHVIPNPRYPNQVYAFGSNLKGIHGAGSALVARRLFGAQLGVAYGPTGRSYAIPTKDYNLNTLQLYYIEQYIALFKRYAKEHPELKFFVTAIGCGLAGYTHADIAPFFRDAPLNCSLPFEWKDL